MNRALASTVVSAFRPDIRTLRERLSGFDKRDWRKTEFWLDGSGLALPLVSRLEMLGLESSIPAEILDSLQAKRAKNTERVRQQLRQLEMVTKALDRSRIAFVLLKGLSLVPEFCPDPCLRYQLDMDLLVAKEDAQRTSEELRKLGYALVAVTPEVWTCKTAGDRTPNIAELYSSKPQQTVELHFAVPGVYASQDTPQITRQAARKTIGIASFPVLSINERFLAQCAHAFTHIRGEWTRISWLLELKNFINERFNDNELWFRVKERAGSNPDLRVALGCLLRICTMAWGPFAPPTLSEWAEQSLTPGLKWWIDRYTDALIYGVFPGSKYYLILERELAVDLEAWQQLWRRKLWPLHKPPAIVYPDSSTSTEKLRSFSDQWKFVLLRTKFHLIEGLRTWWDLQQWNRTAAG